MVELSNANIDEDTVMIKFVNTNIAFITMFHSDPFRTTTALLLTYLTLIART